MRGEELKTSDRVAYCRSIGSAPTARRGFRCNPRLIHSQARAHTTMGRAYEARRSQRDPSFERTEVWSWINVSATLCVVPGVTTRGSLSRRGRLLRVFTGSTTGSSLDALRQPGQSRGLDLETLVEILAGLETCRFRAKREQLARS